MRLAEYLYSDPGTPPEPDYGHSDMLPEMPAGRTAHDYPYSFGGAQGMESSHNPPGVSGIAQMDGQPIHHLAQGYSQETAMRYRHMLSFTDESVDEAKQYTVKDKSGNKLTVEVLHDKDDGEYVASLHGGRSHKMASGNDRQKITAQATVPNRSSG